MSKRINLSKTIVNYAFISTFISIFILNNNNNSTNYFITRVINLVLTLLLLCMLTLSLIKGFSLKVRTYLLILFLVSSVMVVLALRKYMIFHWIYLIFIIYYSKIEIELNEKIKRIIILTSFASISFQMFTNNFLGYIPVLSWQDPNYSAYYLFMFFLFTKRNNYKIISYVTLSFGFLTLSRTYILAVIIYLIIDKSHNVRNFITKFKLNSFYKLSFISIVFVLFVGNYFLSNVGDIINVNDRTFDRITNINDASNQFRFIANNKFIEALINNPSKFLFGVDKETYQSSFFINTPHNSFLALITNYGMLFSIGFLIVFGNCINKLFVEKNYSIIISQFVFFTLLGSGFQGFPGILLFFALKQGLIYSGLHKRCMKIKLIQHKRDSSVR